MKIWPLVFIFLSAGLALTGAVVQKFEEDVIHTSTGDLRITFIGHASLLLTFGGKTIHVDPVGSEGDYSRFSKAALILITHEHFDHLDASAIGFLRGAGTQVVGSPSCAGKLSGAVILKNGEKRTVSGLEIEAVAAYNVVHKRPDGSPFHPKGQGNGYVITFGDKKVYIAGDTEDTPEMKVLKDIAIAFLPMNLPYTMTPEMVAEAAKAFKPKILYPYHYGDTNTGRLVELLNKIPEIEVRIRSLS